MDESEQRDFEMKLSWYERLVINLIKCGSVPKHIAVIADGNRRFAKQRKLNQQSGYGQGFKKGLKSLKYFRYLGIEEVTAFAFSIENFKRDQGEVELLMEMAIEKLTALLAQPDEVAKSGLRLRCIGELSLFPVKLQKLIAELTLLTKDQKGLRLNVCFGYTSSNELSSAASKLYNAVKQNVVLSDEIGVEDLNACLQTNLNRSNPDVLVRTSGEIRFSDFLLMQCNYSELLFTPCLWPEFTAFEVLKVIIRYQMGQRFNVTARARKVIESERPPNPKLVAHLNDELEKTLREMLAQ